jgi:hypothetical protein
VNSVPYYSSDLETDMRQFRELQKCFGPLFINKGMYQAWNQCRQLRDPNGLPATLEDANPSLQPGFTQLDDNVAPTDRYELSDVKSAIATQGWNGIDQKWLRGMGHMNGVSFKLSEANVLGNGVQIGSQNVDLQMAYDATYNPWFSGECTLSLYGQVERQFVLKDGRISITSAAF